MSWGEQICHMAEVSRVCWAVAAGCYHSPGLDISSAANQSEWQVPPPPAHLKDSQNSLLPLGFEKSHLIIIDSKKKLFWFYTLCCIVVTKNRSKDISYAA